MLVTAGEPRADVIRIPVDRGGIVPEAGLTWGNEMIAGFMPSRHSGGVGAGHDDA